MELKPPGKKSSIKVTFGGKEVDLEEAFETFDDIFEDVDEVFSNMEDVFSRFDKNISSKMNELKKRIAKKHSDKYEYVPDKGEDSYVDDVVKEAMSSRRLQIVKTITVFLIMGMLIAFGAIFFATTLGKNKPESGAPTKTTESIYERLEKL